ncbi:glycosyltransferase family 2 protein [Alphaproteobacteria bacterium]|nr:glycosyltransferase family 2 protein [Alphaproteobacteria bacterium]
MRLLSIVFSFRNEEGNLTELVKRVAKTLENLKSWDFELIFVDDDSNDDSLKTLKKLKENFPIKIIRMSRRFGQSACVFAGLEHSSGEAIVYMDSDLQDPPELIEKMVKKFEDRFEIVHTKRIKRVGESKLKMLITKIAYKIINAFASVDLVENVGDFKLISRKALESLLKIKEIDPYVRGLSVWVGYNQCYVEYEREARHDGKTQFPLLRSLNPSKEFLRGITTFSAAPLYFSLFVGMLTIIFSIILLFYGLYLKISGNAIPGTSGIIVAISLFSGVILFTLGVMGIYVSRIYDQIKGRPRYIISEII